MKDIKDEILIKALELQERGEPLESIYDAFPEAAEELKGFFALTGSLREEAGRIEPPSRELLRGALRRARAARQTDARMRIRPAFARLPIAVRILAPALAVALIVFFGSYAPGGTPSPLVQPPAEPPFADDGTNGPDNAVLEAAPAPESSSGPAPASQPEPDAQNFATMQAAPAVEQDDGSAGTATAHDNGGSPSDLADQISDSYVNAAEAEEATLTEQ